MVAIGRNRVAALTCAAIAGILFLITFQFEEMPAVITRGFGAELFPRLVLGVIMLLCVLLALEPAGEEAQDEIRVTPMVFVTGASLAGFMVLLQFIGMLTAILVFLVGVGWLWGERRTLLLLLVGSSATASIWAVFVKGFGVPLPAGSLFVQLAGY